MTADKTKRNEAIDAFRALSILAVLGFHYCVRWTSPHDPAPHFPAAADYADITIFQYGWAGVQLFFMISGFVILKTLLGTESLPQFAANRIARLWPPLILCAALTAIVVSLIGPPDWHRGILDYLASLTLIDPYLISRATGHNLSFVDGAYWSLWVEVRFYAWAALLFLVAGRKHFIGALLALTTLGFGLSLFALPDAATLALELILFPMYLPYFTFGVLIFAISDRRSNVNSWRLWVMTAWTSALILAGSYVHFPHWNTGVPSGFAIANLIMIAAMLSVALNLGWLRFIAQPPLVLIGQASYSLYLLHQSIGVSIMIALTMGGLPAGPVILAVTAGMIAFSIFLYLYFENPARRWVRNLLAPFTGAVTRALPRLKFA